MFRRGPVVYSPLEVEYLKEHRDENINQLCQILAKSRNSIKNKLDEIDGKLTSVKKNKRSYIGKRKDLDNVSFRSNWEANFARYLKYKNIQYLYEPKVFVFDKEKRGATSYLPDFYLPQQDMWIEVKGMLDGKGRSAIKKLKKYYPEEAKKLLVVIASPKVKAAAWFQKEEIRVYDYYNTLASQYKNVIPFWE